MIKQLTCPTTVKLAQTEHNNTQAMNNTDPDLTITYDSETSKERNRVYDDKYNP